MVDGLSLGAAGSEPKLTREARSWLEKVVQARPITADDILAHKEAGLELKNL